jgi:DNA-binding GntR family transcriptional regulator
MAHDGPVSIETIRTDAVGLPGETDNARAYGALKQTVLAGGFRPGEVVTLRALAQRLDIGDTPVREAIKRLISEGAFEALPNRSARVPILDRRELRQIVDLRIELEGRAAALAAENITLLQIAKLRAAHEGMVRAITQDDHARYGELNMAFHFEIYRIADNRTLATLIEALWLRMAPLIRRTRTLLPTQTERALEIACGHHEALLGALQLRDAEGARRAMHADLSALIPLDGYWDLMEQV